MGVSGEVDLFCSVPHAEWSGPDPAPAGTLVPIREKVIRVGQAMKQVERIGLTQKAGNGQQVSLPELSTEQDKQDLPAAGLAL